MKNKENSILNKIGELSSVLIFLKKGNYTFEQKVIISREF